MNIDLQAYRDCEYDLSELARAVREILQGARAAPSDGRVAAYPDERTLRYYQSTGIIQGPARYEGRSAVYGYRHLLQAVAVKLLQAQGLSLAQIQRAIANAAQSEIEAAVLDALSPFCSPNSGAEPAALQDDGIPATGERHALGRFEMGPGVGGPGSKAHPRAAPPRGLTAAEVAPGVTVVIDPEIATVPEEIIARIKRELDIIRGDE
jgi:DNA-binding transcriptional MerR regulator